MPISALPEPGKSSDSPDVFSSKTETFVAALPKMVTEINALGTCIWVQDQKSNGVAGGTSQVGLNSRTLSTVLFNSIPNAYLSNNIIVLPVGTYDLQAFSACNSTGNSKLLITDEGGSTIYVYGVNTSVNTGDSANCIAQGRFTLASQASLRLRLYTANSVINTGLGVALNAGYTEVYSDIKITKV